MVAPYQYTALSDTLAGEPGINSWSGLLAYPACDIAKALSSRSAATSEKILSDPVPKFGWLTAEFEPLEGAKQEDTFPSDVEVTRRVIVDAQQIPAGPSGKGQSDATATRALPLTLPSSPRLSMGEQRCRLCRREQCTAECHDRHALSHPNLQGRGRSAVVLARNGPAPRRER